MTVPAGPFYLSDMLAEWGLGAGHYVSELVGLANVPAAPFYLSQFAGVSNTTASISPTSLSESGTTSSHTFSPVSVSVGGSYAGIDWSIYGASGGSWAFAGGGGSGDGSAYPYVSGVSLGLDVYATLRCVVTRPDGSQIILDVPLEYYRISGA